MPQIAVCFPNSFATRANRNLDNRLCGRLRAVSSRTLREASHPALPAHEVRGLMGAVDGLARSAPREMYFRTVRGIMRRIFATRKTAGRFSESSEGRIGLGPTKTKWNQKHCESAQTPRSIHRQRFCAHALRMLSVDSRSREAHLVRCDRTCRRRLS
jgi:hypothetical protein